MKTPRDKYLHDPKFKSIVDVMVGYIKTAHFTPSEMREAAILASIIYEEHNYRRIRYVDTEVEMAFKKIHLWVDKHKECPRCAAPDWEAQSEDGVTYCRHGCGFIEG